MDINSCEAILSSWEKSSLFPIYQTRTVYIQATVHHKTSNFLYAVTSTFSYVCIYIYTVMA